MSRWAAGGALVVVLGLGLAPGAQAQDKGPNTGRISLSAGIDWTTDYYFRGIRQETSDWIFQPYAEVSLKLYEDPGPLSSVTLTAGLWNRLHGGKTGDEGQGRDPFALNPSVLIAFETAGQADGGKHRGTYLQLGVSPGVALMEKGPVPFGFVPAAFGTWQLKGGVTFLVLGDTLKDVNRGDGVEVIGTVGLAMTY